MLRLLAQPSQPAFHMSPRDRNLSFYAPTVSTLTTEQSIQPQYSAFLKAEFRLGIYRKANEKCKHTNIYTHKMKSLILERNET